MSSLSLKLVSGLLGASVGVEAHLLAMVPVPFADLVVGHANLLRNSYFLSVGPDGAFVERLQEDLQLRVVLAVVLGLVGCLGLRLARLVFYGRCWRLSLAQVDTLDGSEFKSELGRAILFFSLVALTALLVRALAKAGRVVPAGGADRVTDI